MSNKLSNIQIYNPETNPFDRQERISWWKQDAIRQAKVMVVGAGAIGNETLKNLALLGFRNILIVDFDTISKSNLSRTVLFRMADIGKKKAEVAAYRTKELCLAESPNISWLHGDVVHDIGTGIYCQMDLVLGCLDNIATRFAVNQQCRAVGIPWIDAGITELRARVSIYGKEGPCYQCGVSTEKFEATRKRLSCDNYKRRVAAEGKVATVQIAASLVAALQVQEAIKIICHQPSSIGKMLFFEGKFNDFDILTMQEQEACFAHERLPDNIISLPISSSDSLKKLLMTIEKRGESGREVILEPGITFVVTDTCKQCYQRQVRLMKPKHKIYVDEIKCVTCPEISELKQEETSIIARSGKVIEKFSLHDTPAEVLEMSLADIGIPILDVVAVKDKQGRYQYYELAGDIAQVFSSFT